MLVYLVKISNYKHFAEPTHYFSYVIYVWPLQHIAQISLRKSERAKSVRLATNMLTEINDSAVLTADIAKHS